MTKNDKWRSSWPNKNNKTKFRTKHDSELSDVKIEMIKSTSTEKHVIGFSTRVSMIDTLAIECEVTDSWSGCHSTGTHS